MPEIKLFIATSIDGFIARENGSLDWLPGSGGEEQDSVEDEKNGGSEHPDGGYGEFIAGIDLIVVGRKTYEEILGFGVEWPYGDCKTYVLTTDESYETKTDSTFTLNKVNKETIDELKSQSKKDIWLMGGGQLIRQFLNCESVDEMTLNVIPIILGKGIRLFPDAPKETRFKVVNTKSYGAGMVNLTFRKD